MIITYSVWVCGCVFIINYKFLLPTHTSWLVCDALITLLCQEKFNTVVCSWLATQYSFISGYRQLVYYWTEESTTFSYQRSVNWSQAEHNIHKGFTGIEGYIFTINTQSWVLGKPNSVECALKLPIAWWCNTAPGQHEGAPSWSTVSLQELNTVQ